jgi:hypothetical protein
MKLVGIKERRNVSADAHGKPTCPGIASATPDEMRKPLSIVLLMDMGEHVSPLPS